MVIIENNLKQETIVQKWLFSHRTSWSQGSTQPKCVSGPCVPIVVIVQNKGRNNVPSQEAVTEGEGNFRPKCLSSRCATNL